MIGAKIIQIPLFLGSDFFIQGQPTLARLTEFSNTTFNSIMPCLGDGFSIGTAPLDMIISASKKSRQGAKTAVRPPWFLEKPPSQMIIIPDRSSHSQLGQAGLLAGGTMVGPRGVVVPNIFSAANDRPDAGKNTGPKENTRDPDRSTGAQKINREAIGAGIATAVEIQKWSKEGQQKDLPWWTIAAREWFKNGNADKLRDFKIIYTRSYGIQAMELAEIETIDPDLISIIPKEFALKHHCLPLSIIGSKVDVAMSEPMHLYGTSVIREKTMRTPDPIFAYEHEIEAAIERLYPKTGSEQELQSIEAARVEVVRPAQDERMDIEREDSPIVKFVNEVIENAVRRGASDIHFELHSDKRFRVRLRIDSEMEPILSPEQEIKYFKQGRSVIARCAIMAQIPTDKLFMPQSSKASRIIDGERIDLRVEISTTEYGEHAVLRILKSAHIPELKKLGFEDAQLELVKRAVTLPYGMILVTGQTGSGKTTSLYSILQSINDPKKKIITIEDPVEYALPGIVQYSVNYQRGTTFQKHLRSILRQDPDIILVGEIRDLETAETAIDAALTGHLLFSTLHTNNALSTANRMLRMGIPPYLLQDALKVVISQRLARKVCPTCAELADPGQSAAKFKMAGVDMNLLPRAGVMVGRGCDECRGTGTKGRVGIFEVVPMDDIFVDYLDKKITAEQASAMLRERNIPLLGNAAFNKLREFAIPPSEFFKIVGLLNPQRDRDDTVVGS